MISRPFLIRTLPQSNQSKAKIDILKLEKNVIQSELKFYKKIFIEKSNSAVFGLIRSLIVQIFNC